MPTIVQKYDAFDAAFTQLKALDPNMYQTLIADQQNWTGSFTLQMRHDLDILRSHGFPQTANAIQDFWSDPAAWNYETQVAGAGGNAVKKTLQPVATAAAATGQVGQNVANSVFQGLTWPQFLGTLTNKNTWLRVGEAVMGLTLLAIGVAVVAKSTSTGSAVIKTAKKVVK